MKLDRQEKRKPNINEQKSKQENGKRNGVRKWKEERKSKEMVKKKIIGK